jgi:GTPase SAR1 family protein
MKNILVYFIGTAGSGKSILTYAFQQWMNAQGFDAVTVNLDPGAEYLAYSPDVDIRDWLVLSDIMKEQNLGPNGAQIACADMLAFKISEVQDILEGYKTDYILIDTPGQFELFTFRKSSTFIIDQLGAERSVMVFIFDPFIAKSASGFISQMMLSATTQFRFPIPTINVLSKTDMLEEEELTNIMKWSDDIHLLENVLDDEEQSVHTQMNVELFRVLEDMGLYKGLIPISSATALGMAEIYNEIQQVYAGGEDLETD